MASILVMVPEAAGNRPPGARAMSDGGAPPGGGGPFDGVPARAETGTGAGRQMPSCVFSRLEANVSLDEASNSMDVNVRVSLETGRNGSFLIFRLKPGMVVRDVVEEGGGPLRFYRPFWYFYNVSLGRELPAGTALNLTMRYDGPVLNTPDGGASYWDYVGPEGSWVRTYGDYFPSDELGSRTTSRLSVTAPKDKTVVSSGELLARTNDSQNGTVTAVYANDRPVNGISFLAGQLVRSSFDLYGHRYELFFRQDHVGAAASYAAEMARITGFYSGQFGEPGFRNLSVAEVPSLFAAWGQSMPSMLWLSFRNFDGPLPYRIISHELAHQWWGIDIEGSGAGEFFLQEGFAGYSEAMYEMSFYGSRGYLDYCRQEYISRFVHGPGPEPVLVSNDYDLASFKGPWVLHMLRFLLGDDEFNRTLAAFHRDHFGGRTDHLAFQDEVFQTTGRDLSGFLHMWLYSSGRLDYAISDAVVLQGPPGKDRVRLVVESRGVLGDLPMDVGICFEGGQRGFGPAGWNGSGPNATLDYDVGYRVDAVKLDPFNWLLDAYPSNNEAPTRDGFFELAAGAILASPAEPIEGEDLGVSAEVALNTSEGPAEVGVELLLDGNFSAETTIFLDPGGRARANFTVRPAPGKHVLSVSFDPMDVYFEKDETNNRASLQLTVEPRPPVLPDAGIPPGGISVTPRDAVGGRPAFIDVLVADMGPAPADGVAVDVWVDSVETGYVGRSAALSLKPLQTATARVLWTAVSGWHQLTARVVMPPGTNDSDPQNDEATTQVYVNSPPVALLWVSDQRPGQGVWVELSGLQSTDDSRVTHYLFDFGDGEDSGWLAEAGTYHAYAEKGTYQARLMVQDDTGAPSDWSAPAPVKVRDAPPKAALSVRPLKGTVLTNFSFTSRSGDPDGTIVDWAWSFGDGSTASAERVFHNYSRHGDFLVSLTVQDDAGATCKTTFLLTVSDLQPVPAISPDGRPARVGQKVAFRATNSTDQDDPVSALTYVWDFGGGQKAIGPEVSYAFAGPGWQRVTLSASDGNLTGVTWVEVEVRGIGATGEPGGAGPLSWAVLGLLLSVMAALAAYIMYPFKRRMSEEEE